MVYKIFVKKTITAAASLFSLVAITYYIPYSSSFCSESNCIIRGSLPNPPRRRSTRNTPITRPTTITVDTIMNNIVRPVEPQTKMINYIVSIQLYIPVRVLFDDEIITSLSNADRDDNGVGGIAVELSIDPIVDDSTVDTAGVD